MKEQHKENYSYLGKKLTFFSIEVRKNEERKYNFFSITYGK